MLSQKELKVIPSFFLLTGCFEFRKKCLFSLSCLQKCHSNFPCDCSLFSKARYLGRIAFYFLIFKGTKTLFERKASESIKLRKDVLRPRSALACTHLWSSLWMEFCAYSNPNLALKGYIMYPSVSLESL